MLYLDYSANTPVDEEVLQCFCEAERRYPGNANAHHQAGATAKAAINCQRQSGGAAKAGVRGGAAGHPAGRHGGPR